MDQFTGSGQASSDCYAVPCGLKEAYERRGPGGRSNSSQAHQTNATAATLSAVKIHVSLVGRKDLTGEIYRQLRRPQGRP